MKNRGDRHTVVIVGAGFGGIELAKKLANTSLDVTILDRNNYHNFQPLMYQVATGGLGPDSIAFPIRRIFRKSRNIKFRIADVTEIHPESKFLSTSIGEIHYDSLVVATGSATNYFSFEPQKENLLSLKSIPDALDMRSTIIQNIERAANKTDVRGEPQPINVVIIGGGPAGVELAGALAEMRKYVLPKDFPELDFTRMRIYLYEAEPRLLSFMSEKSSSKTLQYLQKLGIIVRVKTRVKDYDGVNVVTEDDCIIETKTVIWTAGVKGAPFDGLPQSSMLPNKRILIDEFNCIVGVKDAYAIGDVAAYITQENPRGEPMLAQVAIQQGKQLASNLLKMQQGQPFTPFSYHNKGVMATIGRRKAVVDLPTAHFQGSFAWFVWMFVHIMSLVGFRNKLITLTDWIINYINYDRPLGLMIRPAKRIRKVDND
jgi:NADH dehydrogenase, FAD-containing subunit